MLKKIYAISLLISVLFSTSIFLLEHRPGFFQTINLKGRDIFFRVNRLMFQSKIPDNILIVHIDDETLKQLQKKWPFPRSLYAESLKRLMTFKCKAVGFDLIFSGSDPAAENDLEFAEMIKQSGNVVIASHQSSAGEIGPDREIGNNAWQIGIVDKPKDSDRVIRRAYRDFLVDGEAVPSWESAIARKAYGFIPQALNSNPRSREDNQAFIINYRYKFEDFHKVSFWRLLEGSVLSKEIQNKVVLIGLSAEIFHDYYHTPLENMAGIAINANTLLTLTNGDFFQSVSPKLQLIFYSLSLWFSCLIGFFYSLPLALFALCVLAGIFLMTSFILFQSLYLFDVWLLCLAMVVLLFVARISREIFLMGKKTKIRKHLSTNAGNKYLSEQYLLSRLDYELANLLFAKSNLSLILFTFRGLHLTEKLMEETLDYIRASIRRNEIVCRWKGDFFCIILPKTGVQEAGGFSEKMRRLLNEFGASKGLKPLVATVSTETSRPSSVTDFLKLAESRLI